MWYCLLFEIFHTSMCFKTNSFLFFICILLKLKQIFVGIVCLFLLSSYVLLQRIFQVFFLEAIFLHIYVSTHIGILNAIVNPAHTKSKFLNKKNFENYIRFEIDLRTNLVYGKFFNFMLKGGHILNFKTNLFIESFSS